MKGSGSIAPGSINLRRGFATAFAVGTLLWTAATFQGAQNGASSANSKTASANSLGAESKLIPRSDYLGDEACARCHQGKSNSYVKTAHHLTSQFAGSNAILGSFGPGVNTMQTSNPNLTFRMDAKGDEFFQTAIWGTLPNQRTHTQRFDLVIGSGRNGQTYLFWDENQLFQLPVGYSAVLGRWINSPGYQDGTASFARGIVPRCLECHATYFEPQFTDPDSNFYNKTNFVLGISCERCHGPGREHVQSYWTNKDGSTGPVGVSERRMVNPAKLSRALQLDICAQCHAGPGEREMVSTFSYVPGQPLSPYIDLGSNDSAKDVDVHGKQVKLLMKSKCFQASPDMSCVTCHDVHKPESALASSTQRCLNCHKSEASGGHAKIGREVANNCVDCHMPILETKVVELDLNGKKLRPRLRTHWIKIYSEGR